MLNMPEKKMFLEDVPGLGNLYYAHVFIFFEYQPIVFVVTDEKKRLYLCLCSEIRGVQTWVLASTNLTLLRGLVFRNRKLYDVLRRGEAHYFVKRDYDQNLVSCDLLSFEELDPLDLPEREVALEEIDKKKAAFFFSQVTDREDAVGRVGGRSSLIS